MPKVNLNELVGYSNTPRPDNMRLIAAWFTTVFQADLAAGTELHITGAHGRLELQLWLWWRYLVYICYPSQGSEVVSSAFKHGVPYMLISISNNFGIPLANILKYDPGFFVPLCEFIWTTSKVRQQK